MMSGEFKETKRTEQAESSRGDSKPSQQQHRTAAADDSVMDFRTMSLEPFSASHQRLFAPHLETKTPQKETKEDLKDFEGPTFTKFHDLPKELGRRVFDNFSPKELSQFAEVSKDFLNMNHTTAMMAKKIGFDPQRQQALRLFIHQALQQQSGVTVLHRALLQPVLPTAPSYKRKIELALYGEILSGRLSVETSIKQISELSAISGEAFLASELLVAKLIKSRLTPWQIEALERTFTLEDICSDRLSPFHVAASKRIVAATNTPLWTVVDLRELNEVQVRGVLVGFTLVDVRHPLFGLIHVEAVGAPYHLTVGGTRNRPSEEILRIILNIPFVVGGVGVNVWQEAINRPAVAGPLLGITPLYAAARGGHVGVLDSMRVSGGYTTPESWRAAITKPLERGVAEGATPIYIAASRGHVGILDSMRVSGDYTTEEWRVAITKPLESGRDKGYTSLYAAALRDRVGVLDSMRVSGGYTIVESWRAAITTPLESGRNEGFTPLYVAALQGQVGVLDSMRVSGGYTTVESWRAAITKPLERGVAEGATPLYIAAQQGQVDVLNSMRVNGGYTTAESWRAAITKPLERGMAEGCTPLYIAALQGHVGVLDSMRVSGGYTSAKWRTAITTPLVKGSHAEMTPLKIALQKKHVRVLESMQKEGGYSKDEWQAAIASAVSPGSTGAAFFGGEQKTEGKGDSKLMGNQNTQQQSKREGQEKKGEDDTGYCILS